MFGVKILDTAMDDMMWLKLCKTFFAFKKDVYICFIYIPPSNSTYTIRTGCYKQLFEKLEQDIEKFYAIGDVLLMGDLNAHINKNDLDFISNELNDNLDDFLPPNYTADAIYKHRNTEIPQTTNSYGKSVIELCIEAQLRILNGRTLGDSKGQLTFF